MNQIRSRIEKIEQALGSAADRDAEAINARFIAQLDEITDAELDRLEAIMLRIIEITEDKDECLAIPAGCEHLRDLIAFVDANEEEYFAAVREASR